MQQTSNLYSYTTFLIHYFMVMKVRVAHFVVFLLSMLEHAHTTSNSKSY